MSFAFCANRAGVTNKEVLDYNPVAYGQCSKGLVSYMADGDVLLDVHLGKAILHRYAPSAEIVVDEARIGFHGRWLVEIWSGGLLWGAPCAQRCIDGLLSRLGACAPPARAGRMRAGGGDWRERAK